MADSIIRCSEHLKNFTLIDNTCLQTETLSMQAMGLFAYLMTLPSDWTIYKSELVKHFSNGRDAVYKAFNELVDAGFITYVQNTDEAGRFTGNTYYIHEQPVAEKDRTVRPVKGKKDSDSSNNTANGKPQPENPYTEIPSLPSTNNTKDLLPSTKSKSHCESSEPTQSNSLSDKDLNSKSHCGKATKSKETKKNKESFSRDYYTQVYNAYFANYKILHEQGVLKNEKPVLNYKATNSLLNTKFTEYGFENVLKAVRESINHHWLTHDKKYDFKLIFGPNELPNLINGTYQNFDNQTYNRPSYQKPQKQWTDDHLIL